MVGIEQEPLELCGNIMLYIHLEVELPPQAQAGHGESRLFLLSPFCRCLTGKIGDFLD